MASTTKIMTCVLALETGNPEDVLPGFFLCGEAEPKVRVGRAEGRVLPDGGSPLRADAGMRYDDAAVVIAEYYGSKAAGLSMDCSLHTEEESRKAVLHLCPENE